MHTRSGRRSSTSPAGAPAAWAPAASAPGAFVGERQGLKGEHRRHRMVLVRGRHDGLGRRPRQRHHTPRGERSAGQCEEYARHPALEAFAQQGEADHRRGHGVGEGHQGERSTETAPVRRLRQQQTARRERGHQQCDHDDLRAEQRSRTVRRRHRHRLGEGRGDAGGEARRGRVPKPGTGAGGCPADGAEPGAGQGQQADQGGGGARHGQCLRRAQYVVGCGPGRRHQQRRETIRVSAVPPLDPADPAARDRAPSGPPPPASARPAAGPASADRT